MGTRDNERSAAQHGTALKRTCLACRIAREAYEAAKEQSSKGAPSAEKAVPSAAVEPAHAGMRSQAGMHQAIAEKLPDKGGSSATASQDTRALGKDAGTAEDTANPAGSGPEMGSPAESKPQPLTKEEKAAAAKERFLARKRKAPA